MALVRKLFDAVSAASACRCRSRTQARSTRDVDARSGVAEHDRRPASRLLLAEILLGIMASSAISSLPALAQASEEPASVQTTDLASIRLKGVEFHLPSSGPDASDTHIVRYPPLSASELSFADALKTLPETERATTEWPLASARLAPVIPGRPGLFLGRFHRGDPLPHRMLFTVGDEPPNDCEISNSFWDQDRQHALQQAETSVDGWFHSTQPKQLKTDRFVKRTISRDLPENFDSIQCNVLDQCYIFSCDGLVKIAFQFGRSKWPRSSWPLLIDNASRIARIVIGEDAWTKGLPK